MISPAFFYRALEEKNINFFTGVPDSLLKNFCAYISDVLPKNKHIIASNEGGAVGLAIGYNLSTGQIPLVYMQNSGLGNIINPLLSLVDPEVCNCPTLLMIGWRGEPGVKDEPQHVKQGRVMLAMLEAMEIPYLILDEEESKVDAQLDQALDYLKSKGGAFALIVRKNIFQKYEYQPAQGVSSLQREQVVEIVSQTYAENTIFVSTTGMTSRELFEIREKHDQDHDRDFLVIGGMGHASQIALAASLNSPKKTVVCLDGDAAMLMHMGGLALNGTYGKDNFIHIVINNGAHESVGGQATIVPHLDLQSMAKACDYKLTQKATDEETLFAALVKAKEESGPHFIEVQTACSHRSDLGRPTIGPEQNAAAVRQYFVAN